MHTKTNSVTTGKAGAVTPTLPELIFKFVYIPRVPNTIGEEGRG